MGLDRSTLTTRESVQIPWISVGCRILEGIYRNFEFPQSCRSTQMSGQEAHMQPGGTEALTDVPPRCRPPACDSTTAWPRPEHAYSSEPMTLMLFQDKKMISREQRQSSYSCSSRQ